MKLNTLKRHKEFVAVSSVGSKRFSKNFIIFCSDNICEDSSYSVGFTAAKRIGNSVQRNRAKRRMRALMSSFLKSNDSVQANFLSIVIIAKANILSERWIALENDFQKILKSAISHHLSKKQGESEEVVTENF